MSLAESRGGEVVIHYESTAAGELVMWSDLELTEEGVVIGSLALARIGSGGAVYSHELHEHSGDRPVIANDSIRGFEDASQLFFTASNGQEPSASNPWWGTVDGPNAPFRNTHINQFDNFTGRLEPDRRPHQKEGRWDEGNDAIVASLRERLEQMDALWLYPAIYYNLAAVASDEAKLVDVAMDEQTHREMDAAEDYASSLEFVKKTDEEARKNLTVFGNVPPERIAAAFSRSRRTVGQIERGLQKSRDKMPLGHFQPPIGWRPGGRTWPYMDPTQANEAVSFGRELRALRNDNTGPAADELDREVEELSHRIDRAWWVRRRIGNLAAAEAKAAQPE